MMMQMLAAGGMPLLTDNIRQADQDNPNGYHEFEPVKQLSRDASWLCEAYGKAVKMVYRLLYYLPPDHKYKLILMRRDIREIMASQEVMLRRQEQEIGILPSEALGSVFQNDLDKLRAWAGQQAHCAMLTVDYNFIIKQPHVVSRDINNFLGCGLDASAMAQVLDIALYRQRQM
jgi:hypothetical protein